jgi:hypothetical protein
LSPGVCLIEWFGFLPFSPTSFCSFESSSWELHAVIDIFSHLILRSRPGSDSYDLYEQLAVLSTALYRYGVIRGGDPATVCRLLVILMSEECEDGMV